MKEEKEIVEHEMFRGVAADAHRLMASLAQDVPGDLGRIVKAVVGVDTSGLGGDIKPPARPIGWASWLIALCCDAYGVQVERAVPVGACMELLGISSAALDAAQDGHRDLLDLYDPESGGEDLPHEQDVWSRRAARVSNASVALIGLFWQALLECGPRYGVELSTLMEIGRLIADRLVQICEAQHLDLTVRSSPNLTLEQYDQILEGKTGEIDGLACEAGAILAGASTQRNLWRTLGVERAVAQQLCDDYLDLAEDLANGQIGHPVLYGLTVADPAQKETILRLLEGVRGAHGSSYDQSPSTAEALQELSTLLQELGAAYYTLTCIAVRRKKALISLNALHLPQEAHERLYQWVVSVDPLYDEFEVGAIKEDAA